MVLIGISSISKRLSYGRLFYLRQRAIVFFRRNYIEAAIKGMCSTKEDKSALDSQRFHKDSSGFNSEEAGRRVCGGGGSTIFNLHKDISNLNTSTGISTFWKHSYSAVLSFLVQK